MFDQVDAHDIFIWMKIGEKLQGEFMVQIKSLPTYLWLKIKFHFSLPSPSVQ